MPERDGYIAGVPCWIDTNQPDPERRAAVLRRPVRLGVRGRDARGIRRASYFIGRIRGGDVAAVGVDPRGRAAGGRVEHLHLGRRRRRDGGEGRAPPAAPWLEPLRRHGRRRMAVFADPEGAVFCVWQPKAAQGRAGGQRARRAELQRPRHP